MKSPFLLAVMGPTASGKSDLAEAIAEQYDAVILNADAFQVYKGMDIGTAKPTDKSRYELLDLKQPDESFGVGEFVLLAASRLEEHFAHGRNVVLCGGTGFYVRALMEEFQDLEPAPDPELRALLVEKLELEGVENLALELTQKAPEIAGATDLKNPVRVRRAMEKVMASKTPIKFSLPAFRKLKLAITPNIELSSTKIAIRTQTMIQNGWVAEVEQLLNHGYGPGDPGFRAIGYELINSYILDGGTEEYLAEKITLETVQYAKRQRTWLRSEPNLIQFSDCSEAHDATVSWATSIEY